jgi:hypothetical protein
VNRFGKCQFKGIAALMGSTSTRLDGKVEGGVGFMVRPTTCRTAVSARNSPLAARRAKLTHFCCTFAILFSVGCHSSSNSKAAHIQGAVTIGGRPLPAEVMANISIRPTGVGQGRPVGSTIVDGKFDFPSAPLGKVKVYVDIQHITGKMIKESDGVPFHETKSIISPKYTSGIDLEITGDNLHQDFDLESSG